jgi:hypothetical protein
VRFQVSVLFIAITAIPILTIPAAMLAQGHGTSSSLLAENAEADGGISRGISSLPTTSASPAPFSRLSIGARVSPFGPGVQVTTYVTNHVNLRATGSMFRYSTDFTTSGFDATARLHLASAGLSADIYPFRNGFRISPGVLVYNGDRVTATSTVASGTSFTLNGDSFYSAHANSATGATPLSASAALGLNSTKPAFTITAGWGNTIPRNGGHWSFPFEAGIAMTGAPSLNATLTGWACTDQAETQCTNVASATDPNALQIQGDLAAQITKWKSDLEPLKTYPVVSFGAAYSFGVRGGAR